MQEETDVQYFMNLVIAKFGDGLKQYEPDFDLPYILFGSFALFCIDLVKTASKSEDNELEKVKEIIEEMALTKNEEVNDLFMVGFLEVFADDSFAVEYSRAHFNKQVNDLLDKILK